MDETHELLTVAEAAQRAGTSPQAIRERIRRGTLPVERGHRGGRLVALVRASALGKVAQGSETRLARALGKGEPVLDLPVQPNVERATVDLLRLELAQVREELAKTQATLALSERMEAAAQRAADKAEAKADARLARSEAQLEQERREKLSLAHELGKAHGERDRALALIEQGRGKGLLARLLGR